MKAQESLTELLHTALNELVAIGGLYDHRHKESEVRDSGEYACLESTLTQALKIATAESDQTPADAEWLESIGWELSKPLGSFMVSPCGRLEFQTKEKTLTHGDWEVVLVFNPTRGAVLKILAGIGGGG